MKRRRVWFPVVTGNSGTDVWTRRLAAALEPLGVDATVTWHHRLFEPAPWLLAGVSAPPGCDLVHANSWNAFAFARRGLPLVATEHQGEYRDGVRPLQGGLQRLYYRALVRRFVARSCARAQAVTAVSHAAAGALRASVPVEAVLPLGNWIDLGRFPAPRRRARGAVFRLLFVGSPSWRKGGDLLLPVLRRLGPSFELRYTSGLKASELASAADNVRCIGSLRGDAALAAAYAEADALLFPTRLEGMSLVTLEAMACGLPIVSSDIPAQAELLDEGAGLLCPVGDVDGFADACRRLADDPALCRDTGARARARVEARHDERVVVPRYAALYESLLDGAVARSAEQ